MQQTHLERVQQAVLATGLDCYIAVVNSKSVLSKDEVTRLRKSAERFITGLSDSTNRWYINLPLILTKHELTQPDMDEDHPTRAIGNAEKSVAALAHLTSKRHLGLFDDIAPGKSLVWIEPA